MLSAPEERASATCPSHRISPIIAKNVYANLDRCLAAGLIQHSDISVLEPLVVIPKKPEGVRITARYKKTQLDLSSLRQLPVVRAGSGPRFPGEGTGVYLFDSVSSYEEIAAQKGTVALTAACTPTGLYEWLVMPPGSSASPGWFVKVANSVINKGLEQVAAYLDDVIAFDSDPAALVKTIRALVNRLRNHNLNPRPSKAHLSATDADFRGHSISLVCLRPHAAKVWFLTKMLMPQNLKQVRALLGQSRVLLQIPTRLVQSDTRFQRTPAEGV